MIHFLGLELAEDRFAALGEDHLDRPAFLPDDNRVDVHQWRLQGFRDEAPDGGLARSRQAEEHDVPAHEAAPRGLRARTCA